MPERTGAPLFLLARFAEFYESVASIKLAIAEGRLGAMLAVGDEPPPTDPRELAARASSRLAARLRTQSKDIEHTGTPDEVEAHRTALYVMAALADEVFVLELDWPGRDAWLDTLLEYRIFRSRDAGVRFFDLADRLLTTRTHDTLRLDLAAVMVLALQLGFKGQYRGEHCAEKLHAVREGLFRLVEREHGTRLHGPAFPQAGQHLLNGGTAARLAPLTPWYMAGLIALVAYLIVSSSVWLALIEPFRRAMENL